MATDRPLNLEEITRRAEAASPGPWRAGGPYIRRWEVVISDGYPLIELAPTMQGAADAAFIAHARTDVPALVAEIKRLRRAAGVPPG